MNDAVVLFSFAVGYVASGLFLLSVSLSGFGGVFGTQMKLVPVKIRSQRK